MRCLVCVLGFALGLAVVSPAQTEPEVRSIELNGSLIRYQVRAGFAHARQIAGTPARTAKPARPGPGRPKGSKNKNKAPAQTVGKRRFTAGTRRKHAAKKKLTG